MIDHPRGGTGEHLSELAPRPTVSVPPREPVTVAGPVGPLPGVEDLLRNGFDAERAGDASMVVRLPIPRDTEESVVRAALRGLIDRHDALRLQATHLVDELWDLEVLPAESVSVDLRWIDADAARTSVDPGDEGSDNAAESAEAHGDPRARLDAATARVVVADRVAGAGADQATLSLALHPFAADACAVPVLLGELAWALSEQGRAELPPTTPQGAGLADYAQWAADTAAAPEVVAQLPLWQQAQKPSGCAKSYTAASANPGLGRELLTHFTVALPASTDSSISAGSLSAAALAAISIACALLPAANGAVVSKDADSNDAAATSTVANAQTGADATRATHDHPASTTAESSAAIAVDLTHAGRTPHGNEPEVRIGRFEVTSPLRLGLHADVPAAVADAREQLARQPLGGLGYALLRHLNPQAALALDTTGSDAAQRDAIALHVIDHTAMGSARVELPDPRTNAPLALVVVARNDERGAHAEVRITTAEGTRADAVADFAPAWEQAFGAATALLADPTQHRLVAAELTRVDLDARAVAAVEGAVSGPLDDIWPLSPLQQGLYFQSVFSTEAADIYTAQFTLEFDRELDADRLHGALAALLRRHPGLRAGFVDAGLPDPVQVVAAAPEVPLRVVDLTAKPAAEQAEAVETVLARDRATGFDLTAPPLWRATLIRMHGRSVLAVNRQFLLWDGWSNGPFIGALLSYYQTPPEDLVPHQAFPTYLSWVRDRDIESAREYWRTSMADLGEPCLVSPGASLEVPVTPTVRTVTLGAQETSALDSCAKQHSVTLNTVLNAALALTISRYLGRTDIVFGNTVAGRPPEIPEIDSAIGMFLGTVPVRIPLRAQWTLAELLARTHADRLDRMEHEYLPLPQILQATGHRQLFDVLFVLQNFIDDAKLGAEHGIVGGTSLDHTHYPLTVVVTPGPQLAVKLEARPDLIDAERAQEFLDEFTGLLARLAADPATDTPLAALEGGGLRGDPIRGIEYATGTASIADLLAEQTALDPDAEALILGDRALTFAELDAEINRVARLLIEAGARPETYVALAIPRTIEMVVALFAVLRTGAGYVPLELEHPDERLHTIIAKSDPAVLLTSVVAADRFLDRVRHTVVIDSPSTREKLDATDASALTDTELGAFSRKNPRRLEYPAYVIFTSGSTGEPKGVVTPYAGLTNMQHNHEREIFQPALALAEDRRLRIAHTVSFAFDMSWEELLWLAFGHTVHVCDEQLRRDPADLVAYCDKHRIDVLNVTPTYAEHLIADGLLEQDGENGRHRPTLVLLGGEAVGDGVWNRLRDTDAVLGYNLYGPTEYTINTLGGGTTDSATPTVGKPIFNTDAYLLDSWLRPVPAGEIGELYVSGIGLARGYLDRADLTAERFVADPVRSGERMYRTGDLVRLDAGGNLEFHGRSDDQVKVRGYRVEPSEIASVIAGLTGIDRAFVIADKPSEGSKTGTRLLGYAVTEPGAAPGTVDSVRDRLTDLLPSYMVPAAVIEIDTVPMTVNGKLDVAALPAPASAEAAGRAPRTPLEKVLCETFSEVLDREVGPEDSFFDLGGHSLLIMTLRRTLRARLDLDIPMAEVFTHPTPAALAAKLARGDSGDEERMTAPVLTLRRGTGGDPVFCLPPGTGLGWQYTQLTRFVPESSSVHAMQAPFITGVDTAPTDIRELARHYADLLVEAEPADSYRLIGYSFGGNVALAVATELQSRGKRVPALVLIDCAVSVPKQYLERNAELTQATAALLSLGIPVEQGDFARLTVADAIERIRATGNFMADFADATIEAVVHSSAWSLEVMLAARYPVFDGDALFVRATGDQLRAAALTADAAEQWSPLLTGEFRMVEVAATHAALLDRTVLDLYGPELERELKR